MGLPKISALFSNQSLAETCQRGRKNSFEAVIFAVTGRYSCKWLQNMGYFNTAVVFTQIV
jgi:hypothetical protein